MDRTCLVRIVHLDAVCRGSVCKRRMLRRKLQGGANYGARSRRCQPRQHAAHSLSGLRARACDRHAQIVEKKLLRPLQDFTVALLQLEVSAENDQHVSDWTHDVVGGVASRVYPQPARSATRLSDDRLQLVREPSEKHDYRQRQTTIHPGESRFPLRSQNKKGIARAKEYA